LGDVAGDCSGHRAAHCVKERQLLLLADLVSVGRLFRLSYPLFLSSSSSLLLFLLFVAAVAAAAVVVVIHLVFQARVNVLPFSRPVVVVGKASL
jgi:hypothetical protein